MLYELIIRLNCTRTKCRKGLIWCTDGSFVSPSEFKRSTKSPYGYALTNDTVVSLRLRSKLSYSWIGAKSYCTEWSKARNAGKKGYCPDKDELKSLYDSIMGGKMKDDLMTAGLYESCNYREASIDGWKWIWSSSEYDSRYAYFVNYRGDVFHGIKSNELHALPFFKF